jgi:hypothetical protein
MPTFYDRVKVLTATAGAGPITLGAAVPPHRTFAGAGVPHRAVVSYLIEDGASWETGRGFYDAVAGVLTRFQFQSSNTGAQLVLSGNATVSIIGSAADLSALSSGQGVARRSNIMTVLPHQPMADAGTGATARTFHLLQTMEAHFDGVRIGFVNNLATTQTISFAVASANAPGLNADASTRDPTAAGGTWVAGTFAGAATAITNLPTVTTSAATRNAAPGITWSDWIGLSSIDRLDGGLPLLHLRMLVTPTSGNVPTSIVGTGGNTFQDEIEAAYAAGRLFRIREYAGDALADKTLMTSNLQTWTLPVVIIQYLSRTEGHSLLVLGDSITTAANLPTWTTKSTQWPFILRNRLSRPDRPVELINAGWSSQSMPDFANRFVKMVADGIAPTLVVSAGYSPNTFTSITAVEEARWRAGLSRIVAAARSIGAPVMPWGTLPSDPSIKPFGATDAKRVAWHNRLLQHPNFVDVRTLVPVTIDGNGQEVPAAGYFSDGLHPTTMLAGLMADAMTPTSSLLLA